MPNCIIMGCPHKTGNNQKFPGIVLHSFPSSIERIKKWILQTGQAFQDPDTLANKIYEGKKTDTFRMCSAHFTKDSYIFTAQKRFLKHNAVPAIFPQLAEGKPLIDEQKIVGKKRRKSERVEPKNISSFICSRCLMSENIYEGRASVDVATQTESNVLGQQPPGLPMTQTVLMLSLPLQSYCMSQTSSMMEPSTNTLESNPIVGYNIQELLKYTNLHNTLAATTSQGFPNPLEDRGGLPLSSSSDLKESTRGEESFAKSTVNPLVQTQENPEGHTLPNIVRDRKLLVFEDCLDSLLYMVKCRDSSGCGKLVKRFNKEYRGSAVVVRGQCEDGHFFKIWESQPRVKRFFAGNVLMAASSFCSGLEYQEASDFLNILGLRHISENKYKYYQKSCCYPAIHAAWERERKRVTQELQDGPVSLAGDGHISEGGGHGVYTLSDTITDKIVDLEVTPSFPCQSSVDLAQQGLEVCMARATSEGLDVACLASDRRKSVVEFMKENYDHVEHQYNVHQYAKTISKKLRAASRSKFCADIRPWIKPISDHFLWSVQTSMNNENLLKEKWLSVLHHVTNQHLWGEGCLYRQCEHEDLSQKTLRETLWLKPGSPSFQKVREVVTDPQLLEDLQHLTWNCHSDAATVFHGNVCKFKTKRTHSGVEELEARVKLAALKHNQDVENRKAELEVLCRNSTSEDTARRKHRVTKQKRTFVGTVCEPTSYDYLWPVMEAVLGICEDIQTTAYRSKAPSIPPTVKGTERPSAVIATHISRLRFKKRKYVK